MPWEKSFDPDEAIEEATQVFWNKGYEATSISDLTHAMSINKGSLYNAFGSKKKLFIMALLRYDRNNRMTILARLEELNDPVLIVSTLFDGLISESLTDGERKGCLLVNTALELPHHCSEVRDLVILALGDFERFFLRTIIQGQELGQIPKYVNPDKSSKSLLALVVGLRVLSRGIFDESGLTAIKDSALKLMLK